MVGAVGLDPRDRDHRRAAWRGHRRSHLLQPFLIGRYVQLNALAVVLALTAGALLRGIAGAILAVPLTATIGFRLMVRRELPPLDPAPADGG